MPTIEVSIYWIRILGGKNDRVVIYKSHAKHILKATKMLLEHIYYIKHILALCYASAGH
jgi:hypothetical protein